MKKFIILILAIFFAIPAYNQYSIRDEGQSIKFSGSTGLIGYRKSEIKNIRIYNNKIYLLDTYEWNRNISDTYESFAPEDYGFATLSGFYDTLYAIVFKRNMIDAFYENYGVGTIDTIWYFDRDSTLLYRSIYTFESDTPRTRKILIPY